MRFQEKQWHFCINQTGYGSTFHQFLDIEDRFQQMSVAEESGISLGQIQRLKKKVVRT